MPLAEIKKKNSLHIIFPENIQAGMRDRILKHRGCKLFFFCNDTLMNEINNLATNPTGRKADVRHEKVTDMVI